MVRLMSNRFDDIPCQTQSRHRRFCVAFCIATLAVAGSQGGSGRSFGGLIVLCFAAPETGWGRGAKGIAQSKLIEKGALFFASSFLPRSWAPVCFGGKPL